MKLIKSNRTNTMKANCCGRQANEGRMLELGCEDGDATRKQV